MNVLRQVQCSLLSFDKPEKKNRLQSTMMMMKGKMIRSFVQSLISSWKRFPPKTQRDVMEVRERGKRNYESTSCCASI